MKDKILNIIKFLAFLLTGLFLFWLVYKDQISFIIPAESFVQLKKDTIPQTILQNLGKIVNRNYYSQNTLEQAIKESVAGQNQYIPVIRKYIENRLENMLDALKSADYIWLWLMMLIAVISHYLRALRWQLLLESLGHKPSIKNSFLAVLVNYIANLAIPRLGEISRCGIMKRYEKIPFTQSFGTVIAERAVDVLTLLLLLCIVLFTQFTQVMQFITDNPEISHKFSNLFSSTYIPIIVIVTLISLLITFFVLRHK
ncbi:MAG: flippase-like domain-containing protein, partial [Bacteroidia bacterium]|nr:flippase-like domain-containing protein [Bacteroidia bacterium]